MTSESPMTYFYYPPQRKVETIKIILGSKGNLAIGLKNKYPDALIIPRMVFTNWIKKPEMFAIDLKLNESDNSNTIIFNASGIIDSRANQDEIMLTNESLPKFLRESSKKFQIKLVTFGTVMENYPKYAKNNNYLNSKLNFYKEIRNEIAETHLHVQMHTLYGGRNLHRFMFIGQIFDAINKNEMFQMSSGEQLREYHHINDDLSALGRLLDNKEFGIHHISHSKPIKLYELANRLFSYYGKEALLVKNSLTQQEFENTSYVFQMEEAYKDVVFRDAVNGIINWYQDLGLPHG